VGVVGDVRHVALEQDRVQKCICQFVKPLTIFSVELVVRTILPPATLAPTIRAALKPLDPNLPANEFRTVQQLVDKATSPRRFVVMALTAFSAFALVLASLGIYASFRIRESTNPGNRYSNGAWSVRKGFAGGDHVSDAAAGGTWAADWAWGFVGADTRARRLLFGVTSTDPVTFIGLWLSWR